MLLLVIAIPLVSGIKLDIVEAVCMDIRTYWNILYENNKIKKNNKISQNSRTAPRHSFNIVHKGYSCMFLGSKRGSITVEASFCVPIFFLALFSLFYIFQCLFSINYVEDSLTDCAREYAVFGTKIGSVTTLMEDKVIIRYDEDALLPVCSTSYSMKVSFLGSRFFKLDFYQQVVINNYSGKSMKGQDGEKGEDKEDFVFIAKSGKVYHCDRGCTYLKPSISETRGSLVSSERNFSGGKYKPCEKCCKNLQAQDMATAYITSYGDRYHKTKTCPGIKRDVRRVKKSETGNLSACSKCGA